MKRNKLYLILAITSAIILFCTSAVCNQCSQDTSEDVAEDTTSTTSASEKTSVSTTTSTTASSTKSAGESAPTISLEIYKGPTYSSSDGVCYYRIKANVTGSPSPTVSFSRDDSEGAWGDRKCQVNLNSPTDTYTLTATATNASGSATDSIVISWGCSEEVTSTSPETVTEHTVEFHPSISGTVGSGPGEATTGTVTFGDSAANTDWIGLFAFDVSSIAGKEIESAELKLSDPTPYNICDFKGDICIGYMDFLPGITQSDYTSGTSYGFPECFPWDADPLEFSTSFLEDKVEERAIAGTELQFQIAYALTAIGGLLDVAEGRLYQSNDITLTVTYIE